MGGLGLGVQDVSTQEFTSMGRRVERAQRFVFLSRLPSAGRREKYKDLLVSLTCWPGLRVKCSDFKSRPDVVQSGN